MPAKKGGNAQPHGTGPPTSHVNRLVECFWLLERQVSGLQIQQPLRGDGVEPVGLEGGLVLVYHPGDPSPSAAMWIGCREVLLKVSWSDGIGSATELEDRLPVRLGDPPECGNTRYESYERFAAALLQLMFDRISDLRRPCCPVPRAPDGAGVLSPAPEETGHRGVEESAVAELLAP